MNPLVAPLCCTGMETEASESQTSNPGQKNQNDPHSYITPKVSEKICFVNWVKLPFEASSSVHQQRLSQSVCPSELYDNSKRGLTRERWANTCMKMDMNWELSWIRFTVIVHQEAGYHKDWDANLTIMLWNVQTSWGRNDSRKNIQTSRNAGCIYDPNKLLRRPKKKVKLEVQSKTFSCTPWQTYSKLFGMYDQQNLRFIISFIFFSSI